MLKAVGVGQSQQTTVSQGSVYSGIVTGWDPDTQQYRVSVRGLEVRAVYAASVCSRLLGIQTQFRIPAGTEAEVLASDGQYIILSVHANNEWFPGNEKDTGCGGEIETPEEGSGDRPMVGNVWARDLLSGELDMTNALHAGIQLLTTFARIQGGDRALVETHVLDDLVRIVSGAFRHHSAFGDHSIYEREGFLNSVEHGTSYDHEAWGVEEQEPKFEEDDGKPDPETVAEIGRWRYSKFVGYLGDFVHLMVSDPVEGLGRLGQNALRAGKARVQIQSDGTLLAQSVADIVLERVCRVQIPVQLHEPQQLPPEAAEQLENAETRFSKIWAGLQEESTLQDLAAFSYQLREYARWLGSYQSLARFATEGRWRVPSESETPTPEWTNKEGDRTLANEGAMTHLDVYACIRIMRDGSIVVHSGDGSSLVMAGGNVQVHASRTLELAAGGDVVVRAGRDLLLDARRNVRVMAVVGSLTLKARTFWHAICEYGTMRLDAVSNAGEMPEPGDGDPDAVVEPAALNINAGGQARINATKRLLLESEGSDGAEGEDREEGGVEIHAPRAGIRLQTRGLVTVHAREIWSWATRGWFLQAQSMLMDLQGVFRVKDRLSLKGGTLQTQRVQAQILDGRVAVFGPEAPEAAKKVGMMGRTSQTRQEDDSLESYHNEPDSSEVWEDLGSNRFPDPPEFEEEDDFDNFPDHTDLLDEQRETVTDQFLRRKAWNGLWPEEWESVNTWRPSECKYRVKGKTVDPYPGNWTRHFQYNGGASLNEPSSTPHESLTTGTDQYTTQNTIWNYFNPNEEP